MDVTLDDRLNVLQQISQKKLIDIFDKIPGKKDLIIEQKLMKILDNFIGITTLRKCGVDKIYKLEPGLKPSNPQRIFFISNDLISCKKVLDQIQSERSQSTQPMSHLLHHMLVTPFIPYILHSLVEEQGLAGLVELKTFSWEFIRIDDNVLSLEIPLFVDLYFHRNPILLSALSRSLWSLKHILGSPKLILSFGKQSRQILTQIELLEQNLGSPSKETELGAFIIMNRNYDFATTLLTPVTYGGLLHEVMDINVGVASLEKFQIKLDPRKDPIYKQVRDTPCSEVFPILHEKAKSLKSEQGAIQTMKLAEMERYIATRLHKSREMTQQLAFHISACQKITDTLGSSFQNIQSNETSILECRDRKECLNYIERNIDDFPLSNLRLLCLLSLTSDGITQNELRPIQKSHLHAHGYQNIPLFYKLHTAGLLRYKTENLLHKLPNWNSEWTLNAQRLKLLPKKREDNKLRTCPSYVFNDAYIPVIAQILNLVASQDKEGKNLDELSNYSDCHIQGQKGLLSPKIILICIVGGITWAEISACRLLEKLYGIRLVLVSDFLITGNRIIEKMQMA